MADEYGGEKQLKTEQQEAERDKGGGKEMDTFRPCPSDQSSYQALPPNIIASHKHISAAIQ